MLRNLAFITMFFMVRNIDDDFSIGVELRQVALVYTFCSTTYTILILFFSSTVFVTLGYCQYILMAMSLALLYLTAWRPILLTYKQSRILPFSLSLECLSSVESAMIQPIPSQYFYEYLCEDISDK